MTAKHPLRAIPRTSYPRPVIKGRGLIKETLGLWKVIWEK
jgi:hypothetical protein